MNEREIPRNPKVPDLNEKAIRLLTELCFRHDDTPAPADIIFVFSTPVFLSETADAVSELLRTKMSNKVFITGGMPEYADSRKIQKPEHQLLLDHVPREEFPDVEFFTERRSRNTLENVTEALKVYDFRNCGSAFFIFKAHACGRGYLTLRRFLSHARILQKSVSMIYEGTTRAISKESWHTFAFGRERVFGEYLRIRQYGGRGDIAFDEVRALVDQIDQETGNF